MRASQKFCGHNIWKLPYGFTDDLNTIRCLILSLQDTIPLDRVTGMNISIADRVDGPFCLEIEDIRLRYNPEFGETLAYEDYILPEKNFNQT